MIDRDIRWNSFIMMAAFISIFIIIGLVVAIRSMSASSKQNNRGNNKYSLFQVRKQWREKQVNHGYSGSFIDFLNNNLRMVAMRMK